MAIRGAFYAGESEDNFVFHCPGCGMDHPVRVRSETSGRPSWTWNGSMDRPTFQPSLLVRWRFNPGSGVEDKVCHSFITDGRIQFLSDCTHKLAGQTVDIPEWSQDR